MSIDLPEIHPAVEVEACWVTPLKDVAARLPYAAVATIAAGGKKGVPYSVRRLTADSFELTNCANGKVYIVSHKFASCDCGDANFRLRSDGLCKHRRAVKELMQQLETTESPP